MVITGTSRCWLVGTVGICRRGWSTVKGHFNLVKFVKLFCYDLCKWKNNTKSGNEFTCVVQ